MTTMNLSMEFPTSNTFDHSGEEQRSPRQFRNDDEFVDCVCAIADTAHAVERGNAHAGGEVAVGAAAYGGFFELPSHLEGDRLRFFVKGCYSGGSLHGEAVDSSGHLEFAVLVEGLECAQLSVKAGRLFRALDADIDAYGRFSCDHIRAR